MEQRIFRIATLVVCAVLSYSASACGGGGADGLDAVSAGGAADVSGDNTPGGARDDELQRSARIVPGDGAGVARSVTELRELGGEPPCRDCKPRVVEPLPLPLPGPAPVRQ